MRRDGDVCSPDDLVRPSLPLDQDINSQTITEQTMETNEENTDILMATLKPENVEDQDSTGRMIEKYLFDVRNSLLCSKQKERSIFMTCQL